MEEGFNLPKEEEKILKFWNERRIFEKSLEKTKKGKPFTFYDGPPFATGLPHYGHILASTIKDVIPRYQTMRGRFVRRRWGWDCHGLPIEEIVERKLGISGKKDIEEKIGIAKFNEICRSTVLTYVAEWGKMVERIARWVEFDDSYKTMDRDYMESVWWAFGQAYKKDLVYEGRKVLLYCPRCETPVSNFEVAMDNSYKDVTDESVIAKFEVRGSKFDAIFGRTPNAERRTYLLAWTTTPWTLPGNVALAVGKDITYAIVEREGEYFILAKDLVSKVFAGEVEVVKEIKGKGLLGLEYEPLFDVPSVKSDKAFKVYDADFVSTEEGTGIVHTAVVYGEDDYRLGQKVGLPVVPLLDEKGKFNDNAPEFLRGVYFKDADQMIIANLEKRKLVFKKEKYTHSYPHCWRCGMALYYNAIPAWFVNTQKLKPALLKTNAKEMNWYPAHLKTGRYQKSLESAPDRNISRNRFWGNPMPIWKCKKCNEVEVVSGIDELSKKAGKSNNEYWVMRHGESEVNVRGLIDAGQQDFHLTEKGKEQVVKGVRGLKRAGIEMIVSSDVLRARESAEIAAPILGVKKVTLDKRIREIGIGVLTGKPDRLYHEMFPTYESKFAAKIEGGETFAELRSRMWSAVADLEKKYKGKKILLISHDYPTWMLFQAVGGWDERRAIAEKENRGIPFINHGEVMEMDVKLLPRNDNGEVELHRPYIDEITLQCSKCGSEAHRISEIFDSWTEAGSMPFAEYHYPFENKKVFESRFPAQFIAEYIAQTRAWFYVLHEVSQILFGRAPVENLVTTGTILAEDGSKMSKSKNNFPDPWEVINKYGADALRFYLMNSVVMQADNLNFSVKDLESIYRKVNLILWNVNNYYKTYLSVESWNKRPKSDPRKAVLDKWITGRTHELVAGVTGYLDAYDTVKATRTIQEYVDDLSTWYVRRSRGRNDKAFFETLAMSLGTVSRVIAPFMPYLAEMIYLGLERKKGDPESVHLAEWPRPKNLESRIKNLELMKGMAEIRRLASLGLAKRAEAGIKVRQPLAKLGVRCQVSGVRLNKELLGILADEVNVKEVICDPKISAEVELDTAITPELKEEGMMRELKRTVQELRQKADLKPGQQIMLMLDLPKGLASVVSRHEKAFKAEVSAKTIHYGKSDKFDAELETTLDRVPVWLGIKKSR